MLKNHPARNLARMLCCLLFVAVLLAAANVKLYLKDGTYQLVREYQVQDDRVRLYSVDRDEWEEVPASLVDLQKTQAEIKAHAEEVKENVAANAAEEKAEEDARKEVERVPQENGVYLIEEDKLTPMKAADAKIDTNKKRTVLKLLSPIPLVSGKATLELDGAHATAGTANREPEFYIRMEEDERMGIVRLGGSQRQSRSRKIDHRSGFQGGHRGARSGGHVPQTGSRRPVQDLAHQADAARRIRGDRIHRRQSKHARMGLLHRARNR